MHPPPVGCSIFGVEDKVVFYGLFFEVYLAIMTCGDAFSYVMLVNEVTYVSFSSWWFYSKFFYSLLDSLCIVIVW